MFRIHTLCIVHYSYQGITHVVAIIIEIYMIFLRTVARSALFLLIHQVGTFSLCFAQNTRVSIANEVITVINGWLTFLITLLYHIRYSQTNECL